MSMIDKERNEHIIYESVVLIDEDVVEQCEPVVRVQRLGEE